MAHCRSSLLSVIELEQLRTQFTAQDWQKLILGIYNAGSAAFFKFIKALPAEKLAPML
ncbi:MAG: hypothetical protein GY928_04590, partial [Colwellia sp.]|nr:hypothetical protein [Colwellia sp.]